MGKLASSFLMLDYRVTGVRNRKTKLRTYPSRLQKLAIILVSDFGPVQTTHGFMMLARVKAHGKPMFFAARVCLAHSSTEISRSSVE